MVMTAWDHYLPYVLYAYRVSAQASTQESPFFLLYGRDARQPVEEALSTPTSPYLVDLDDYKHELDNASQSIESAQAHQRKVYDRQAKEVKYTQGDRVMVYMPHEVTGKSLKFARPFFGPYRVLSVTPTNIEVFVSLDRIRPCYDELPDVSWSGHSRRRRKKGKSLSDKSSPTESPQDQYSGPVTQSRAS